MGRLRVDNTEAEVDIEFDDNNTTTGESIPSADDVAETLSEGVSDPNNSFNLTFDEDTIKATGKLSFIQSGPTSEFIRLLICD